MMTADTNPLADGARIVERRAWLPVRLDGGRWIWRGARYYVIERVTPDYGGWTAGTWHVVARWADSGY